MRARHLLVLLVAALFGCGQPPPSAFVGGAAGGPATALGRDANGESCNQLHGSGADSADIFCGTWQQPAARVRGGPPADRSSLLSVASTGLWRESLNARLICAAPVSTTVLDGQPAALLQCKRRIGGWPQIALAARVGGRLWLADGILPTLPVMQRSMGILSGLVQPTAAALPRSAADALLTTQLAAHAFGAGDVGDFEKLMALGAQANLAENFASAEQAYRAALAIQQKVLGRDNPDTVDPLMNLALQISDQGRFAEASTLFARAAQLAPHASDVVAPARLLHYRALHALNQDHTAQALALLRRAEAGYRAVLPPGIASGGGTPAQFGSSFPQGGMVSNPTTESALIGLIEAERYGAVVLRRLGRHRESTAAIEAAQSLAAANHLTLPVLTARLTRTAATTAGAAGHTSVAELGLAHSAMTFNRVLPETRPVAETTLLQAGEVARLGQTRRAIVLCRAATGLLRKLRSGTDPALLAPCLGAYAAEAAHDPQQAQALRADMFETAQLAQDSLTARQIAEAAARLAENARDPRVAAAIRRRQEATQSLERLYRERDALQHGAEAGTLPPPAVNPAELDKGIAAAQAELADADSALQVAAPNYGQLVQDAVPASQVLAALRPDEAFVAITLTGNTGWEFVLRRGRIDAARLPVEPHAVADLVRQIRASIEPGPQGLPRFDVAAAQRLYTDVLGPLAPRLDGVKALVVAPSGPLLSLPFAVLLTGPADAGHLADAPWLIRRMTIAHVPSAQNFVALRKIAATSRARQPWFGFGDFRPVTLAQAERSFPSSACADSARLFAGLPPLPFAARELEAARQLLHGSRSDELLGAAFTVPAVMRAPLKDFRVLHFAAHALLPTDLRCQSQPAIVTSAPAGAKNASDALLATNDVLGLDLDANLVILSACNSGGPGGADAGDSLSGLARAFFFAGARALLVTHWSISDQSSAFLVADTLRRYASGANGGLAGSLQAAELGMIDGAGRTLPAALAHPFYWAPFALIGEGSSQPAPQHAAEVGSAGETTAVRARAAGG